MVCVCVTKLCERWCVTKRKRWRRNRDTEYKTRNTKKMQGKLDDGWAETRGAGSPVVSIETLYCEKITEPFTHRSFYTAETLLHTDAFTHKHLTHRHFYTLGSILGSNTELDRRSVNPSLQSGNGEPGSE